MGQRCRKARACGPCRLQCPAHSTAFPSARGWVGPRRLRGWSRRLGAPSAGVAQSVAHLSCKQGVEGSSPFASSTQVLLKTLVPCCYWARAAALTVGTGVVTDDHEKSEISHGYRTTVARNRCVMSGRSRRRGFGYVRKLPSGRWQASYLGPDLVRRTAPHTFEAKADAEGWLGGRREEVVSGEWQPPVKVRGRRR